MNDNRDALLRDLRKLARELPLESRNALPDDDVIDRLIVRGHPLETMEGWIHRAAERRIAKRFGNRPAGAVDMRNRLIRWLVSKYMTAGLKRADVIREVAKAADLKADTVPRNSSSNAILGGVLDRAEVLHRAPATTGVNRPGFPGGSLV